MRVSSSIWPVVIPANPFGVDRLDDPARIQRAAKHLEAARREGVPEVGEFQAETGVGLVAAVAVHRLGVGQAREGRRHVEAERLFEHGGEHALHQRDDVLGRDETRLDVHLGKFQLPVGAQVFVAETLGDLEIFLQPRDHEELFVLLRGLRQARKTRPVAGVRARGNPARPRACFWKGWASRSPGNRRRRGSRARF